MGWGSVFAAQHAISKTNERDVLYDFEGVVVQGSWDPTNGTIQVQDGQSYSVLPDSGDQPLIITATLVNTSKGQQGPPVGGERVTVWQSQSGLKATLENSYDEAAKIGTPAGEWWQVHFDQNGEIDAFYKMHTDAFEAGDGQASHEILSGAKHSQTTTGGLTYAARDDVGKIGVGKDPTQLTTSNNATRQMDVKTALQNAQLFTCKMFLKYTKAIVANGGIPTGVSAESLLATLLGAGFPDAEQITELLTGTAPLPVPNCSNIVLVE